MSDKKAPIADPDRSWRVWHIDEIYHKDESDHSGRYIPNPGDLIFSETDGFYTVEDVDYTNGEVDYKPWYLPKHDGISDDDDSDRLLTTFAGLPSQSYRLYLDTSVVPHTVAVDARLKIYGSVVKHMRLFVGYDAGSDDAISRDYDSDGELIDDKIPLEKVRSEDDAEEPAIKVPAIGYCSRALDDGEVVTAVFYDDHGHAVSTATLLVKNTSWIRRAQEHTKTVVGIEIESSFISQSDPLVIDVPVNINMESVPMHGIVHYSSGESRRLPIDDTKFKCMGLKQFVSSIVGQRQPLTLIYYLDEDEQSDEALDHGSGHIAQSYSIKTSPVDGAYSAKIYTAAEWLDKDRGYRLKHFLYTLERDEYFDVTEYVRIARNSPSFDPLLYGTSQDLTFVVDLNEVDSRFAKYKHLQTTRIELLQRGDRREPTHWKIHYDRDKDPFGGMIAEMEYIGTSDYRLVMDNGYESKESWLRQVYRRLQPIHHPRNEDEAPEPTHFKLHVGDWSQEYSIDMWDADLTVPRSRDNGQLVHVQFIRRSGEKDYQLAMASLVVIRPE